MLLIDLQVRGLDGQRTPAGHRVAGIDGQVQDHLLDLSRVAPHHPECGLQGRHELDVLPKDPAQQLLASAHDGVQVKSHRRDDLLASERE